MILPDIVETRRISENEVILVIDLPPGHRAFAGHFPGRPILPGVVQTDWAVRLAAALLATGRDSAREFQVKFREPIGPGPGLRLALRIDRTKAIVCFDYYRQDRVAAQGRFRLDAGS